MPATERRSACQTYSSPWWKRCRRTSNGAHRRGNGAVDARRLPPPPPTGPGKRKRGLTQQALPPTRSAVILGGLHPAAEAELILGILHRIRDCLTPMGSCTGCRGVSSATGCRQPWNPGAMAAHPPDPQHSARGHNPMTGTRIGEASNPGPRPSQRSHLGLLRLQTLMEDESCSAGNRGRKELPLWPGAR